MKPKNLNQKLYLSKRTIADLSPSDQQKIQGGWYLPTECAQSCVTYCGEHCATVPQVCGKTPYFTIQGLSCN